MRATIAEATITGAVGDVPVAEPTAQQFEPEHDTLVNAGKGLASTSSLITGLQFVLRRCL